MGLSYNRSVSEREKSLTPNEAAALDQLRVEVAMVASHANDRLVYRGYQEFVLRHGRVFTLDRETRPARPARDFPATTPKECFTNALQAAAINDDLTYVEGYAYNGLLPIHHAWVVDDAGNVYDPTWENIEDRDMSQDVYIGVPFETIYACITTIEKGSDTLLDWQGGAITLDREPDDGAIREMDVGIPVPKSKQGPDPEALAAFRKHVRKETVQ
jgi:hypothetical protein